MELTEMPLSQLSENVSNPRTITDTKLERLVESILVFPRMLSLRHIVVDENNVILGGNMRFRALSRISSMKFPTLKKMLSGSATFTKKTEFEREQLLDYWRAWLRSPVAPVSSAASLSSEERREFIIKDNVGFGAWDTDALSDEWSDIDFDEWGLDEIWKCGQDISPDDCTDEFSLPDGDKSSVETMKFICSSEQIAYIREQLKFAPTDNTETFGNTNKNGNAIYSIVKQWADVRKSS